jgi:transposase-like protein
MQRCEVHKMCNMLDQLADKRREFVWMALRRACKAASAEDALKRLEGLAK